MNTKKKFTTKLSHNSIYKTCEKQTKKFYNYAEKNPLKSVFIIYLFFVTFKIILSQLYIFPAVSFDSYQYLKMSNSVIHGQNFLIDGLPSHKYPPLYPIAISPASLFSDATIVNRFVLIINSFLSSLIIFPAFLLSKEFFKTKKAIKIGILISILPINFCFSFLIFSENLFFPLFLMMIYTLYKSITTEEQKYMKYTGVFLGLCILTKYSAFAILPAIFIMYSLCYFFKYYNSDKPDLKWLLKSLKHWIITAVITVIIVIPWLIRNYLSFSSSVSGVVGYESFFETADEAIIQITTTASPSSSTAAETLSQTGVQYNIFLDLLIQIIINHGLILLSSGIILCVLGLLLFHKSFKTKNQKMFNITAITFITVEFLILMTSFHNLSCTVIWRLNGRYIEAALPLIIITGFIAYKKIKIPKKLPKILLLTSWPILFVAPTVWESYGNQMSVSYIVLIKQKYLSMIPIIGDFFANNTAVFKLLFLLIILLFLIYLLKNHSKKLVLIFSILIILSATIVPTMIILKTRAQSDVTSEYQLGTWINEHTKDNNKALIFDKEMDYDMKDGLVGMKIRQRLGSWSTSEILLEQITEKTKIENNFSYIISFRNFNSTNFTQIINQTILLPVGWINPKTAEGEKNIFIYTPKKH